ncbi:hypothetical protein B0H21DRAFT_759053 [Amylocystis lapponica]|nr:hypothetical protein B0H21DRAFT_759053 [Amylocystis lapponica]
MSGWDASEVQVLSDALSEVHGSSDMHQPCCPSTSGGLALDTSTDSAAQDEHENTQVDVPEEEEFERPHWKKSEALWKVACKWRVGLVMEAYGQGAICETVRKEAARHRGVRERTVEPCGHESDWGSAVDGSELGFDDEVETEDRGRVGCLNQEEDAVTDNERSESESEDTQYSEHSRSRSPTPDSEHSRSRSPTPDSDHDSDPDSLPYLGLIRLSRFPVEPLEEQFPEPQWLGTPGWLPNHSDVRGSLLDADT